jgi:hypothetical protein
MRKGRRGSTIAGLALATLLAAAAGWWFGSPWWTLYKMREAAEARDAKALSAYIDFGALRRSTRAQLKDELGPIAGAVATAAIRPETVRLLFLAGAGPKGDAKPARWSVTRHGLDRFRAAPDDARRGKGTLTFRRDGFSWKLEEITIAQEQPEKS